MRRNLVWLPVILLFAVISWRGGGVGFRGAKSDPRHEETAQSEIVGGESNNMESATQAGLIPVSIDPDVRQAFRFRIDEGKVTLEKVEDLRGKFKTRRGEPDWWPGMFCYRLLDGRGRLLAEETQPAPDQQCVVLDPHVRGPDGKPKASALTPDGPVVFQIRMPKDPRAAVLKVYRLTGPRRPMPDAEPAGIMLASIAVPK